MFGIKLQHRFQDENDGEGSDLGGGAVESIDEGEEPTPAYLFGDVTSDEATEQFGYLRGLPDQLRGLESRVSDSVSPVMERLKAIQESMGSQSVFDPKLEKVAKVLQDYDPKLAEALLPALIEDLKGSMSVTPLGAEALEPHINPMLQANQQSILDQVVPTLLDSLPFDLDGIVNRDPQSPDNVLAPQTDLQKDFAKWWEHADAPTRTALSTIGLPYVQALQRFGKWRAGQMRKKGKAAGDASDRLSGASQRSTGGRREAPSRKLESESDGFNSVFKNRS